jgi:hypothetical protein
VAQLAGAVDVVEVERVGAFHRTTASRAGCAVDQRVKLASSFGAVLACVVGPAPCCGRVRTPAGSQGSVTRRGWCWGSVG